MSEEFEQAHENLEHAAHGHSGKGHTRPANIIGIMAAALALIEFAAKDAQTNYLTNHIAASDTWAQYQAKAVRRTVLISEAELLQSLPTANDPVVQNALAHVLLNDPNSGMRTRVIQTLDEREGQELNRQMVGALQELMSREDDQDVRERASRMLHSIKASDGTY